jgi:aminoglycoside phosphotransferase (APT) family kinase protein
VTIGGFSKPKSGFSAETAIFTATVETPGGDEEHRFVLRREAPDPPIYPRQNPSLAVDVDVQYRVMTALRAHADVPLAPLVGFEPHPAALGAPFYVMGHVAGEVAGEDPPYPTAGFFAEAFPDTRRAVLDNGLAQLAAVHAVDWETAGLHWLAPVGAAPGTAQQLALWEAYGDSELAGRVHPDLAEAWRWLRAHAPAADRRVGLCWGDSRPGNIIFDGARPACLTDFEAASLGAPEQDLGWWLMFDRTMHPDGTRLPGDLTRDEQRELYAKHAGIDVPDTFFHEVFAAARYVVIILRVMNRLVGREVLPADHTLWLTNPGSDALAELLAER